MKKAFIATILAMTLVFTNGTFTTFNNSKDGFAVLADTFGTGRDLFENYSGEWTGWYGNEADPVASVTTIEDTEDDKNYIADAVLTMNRASSGDWEPYIALRGIDYGHHRTLYFRCEITSTYDKKVFIKFEDKDEQQPLVSEDTISLKADETYVYTKKVELDKNYNKDLSVCFDFGKIDDTDNVVLDPNKAFKIEVSDVSFRTDDSMIVDRPVTPSGVIVSNVVPGAFDIVMGDAGNGQKYNLYLNGKLYKENMELGNHTISGLEPDEYKVELKGLLNGYESDAYETNVTIPEETIATVNIVGYQISTNVGEARGEATGVGGFRTIYDVNVTQGEIVEMGLVYGLEYGDIELNENNMVVGSKQTGVCDYIATDLGKISDNQYAMTMKFIDKKEFYESDFYVRAYAKTNYGTYIYSDIVSSSVFDLAECLYVNRLLNVEEKHNYLYNTILKIVNPGYTEVVFDQNKTIVEAN